MYRNEGEIVPPGQRAYKLDQDTARNFVETLGIDQRLAGVEPTKKIMAVRVQERERQDAQRWSDIRSKDARMNRGGARALRNSGLGVAAKTSARIVGKTLDTFADAFESIFSPERTPEQSIQDEVQKHRRNVLDHAAQQQREEQEQQLRRQQGRDR